MRYELKLEELNIEEFARRYHFEGEQLAMSKTVYEAMKPLVKAVAYCEKVSESNSEADAMNNRSETDVIDTTDKDSIGEKLLVAITLGDKVSALSNLYMDAGALLEGYMVDCLGMELLALAYSALEEEALDGQWICNYHFPGDEDDLCLQKDILEKVGAKEIHLSRDYQLLPKQSVTYIATLTSDRRERCSFSCKFCKNTSCPNRIKKKKAPIPKVEEKTLQSSYGISQILHKRSE